MLTTETGSKQINKSFNFRGIRASKKIKGTTGGITLKGELVRKGVSQEVTVEPGPPSCEAEVAVTSRSTEKTFQRE